MVRSYGLSDPKENDHRTRSPSPDDLVIPCLEGLGQNRSQASSSASGVASEIAKIMAVPSRLSLGCQRQSLHLPCPRAEKSRRPDARVSNELATIIEAEASRLSIRDSTASLRVAILSYRSAATHTGPVALLELACINGRLDRSRQRSNNLSEQLQREFPSTTVSSVDVSTPNQKMSAAWQGPRCRLRNSKR
jgi:hypothetical protein